MTELLKCATCGKEGVIGSMFMLQDGSLYQGALGPAEFHCREHWEQVMHRETLTADQLQRMWEQSG